METLEIKNIYGVAQTPRGYAVALDVKAEKLQFDDKVRLYYRIFGDTRYKKLDFAIKKADERVRHLHQDFINFQGKQVKFSFKNVGLLPEARTEVSNAADFS
jgi:hypothetical protein